MGEFHAHRDQLRRNLERTRELLDEADGMPLETFKILDSLFGALYAIYLEAAGILAPTGPHSEQQSLSMQELYEKMQAHASVKGADSGKKVEDVPTGQYL